jgi:mono/diheme cytochrome c family protein
MALTAALFLACSPPGLAERTIEDAVYSRDQARAGKKLYDRHCIACHERGYFREVLRTRRGETLHPLFELMVTAMPQNAPGSLSDDEYVEVIAYMLSQSRYAHGDAPLTVPGLRSIRIPVGE